MQIFDPNVQEVLANPYPVLRHHQAAEPVFWNPALKRWMILKQKDMIAICRDPRASSKNRGKAPPKIVGFFIKPLLDGITKSLLFLDNPEHKRLRSIINSAFSPKFVASLQTRIESVSEDLLANVSSHRTLDIVSDYAFPLPVIIISELLGVDSSDREVFKEWSNKITRIVVKPKLTAMDLLAANTAVKQMRKYFHRLFSLKRKNPKDDLISYLLTQENETINSDELFSMCMLILIAGHETTTNQIGLGAWNLLRHRDQWDLLCKNPEMIDGAVDEILRYDCSVQSITRTAIDDISIRNKTIKKGDTLLLSIGACNRDPEIYEHPDTFDISRKNPPHISFGHGPHFCLGASLTKMELKVALLHLTKKFPNMELLDQKWEWIPALSHRGLKKLNVRI